MLSRREALLGVLLAPLVKPVAAMLPTAAKESTHTIYWSVMQDGSRWDYTGEVCRVVGHEESFDQLLRRRAIEVASSTEERLFLSGDMAVFDD